jgi:hypothetical protein
LELFSERFDASPEAGFESGVKFRLLAFSQFLILGLDMALFCSAIEADVLQAKSPQAQDYCPPFLLLCNALHTFYKKLINVSVR